MNRYQIARGLTITPVLSKLSSKDKPMDYAKFPEYNRGRIEEVGIRVIYAEEFEERYGRARTERLGLLENLDVILSRIMEEVTKRTKIGWVYLSHRLQYNNDMALRTNNSRELAVYAIIRFETRPLVAPDEYRNNSYAVDHAQIEYHRRALEEKLP